ncbi:hypothetical protein BO71DRAFT_202260 [Aspergillus ellipticus CBS 707.79]|uniref:Uncharacterized protein n=1 Tax=Aspergillus ellipticus CBS 707.79 TaxID=1448320 RepID=A0A319E481_9EURO|nr:hypothetical protein BO71DRAFT_202260 [Aspergillus ellipticus CBS 707.79]
MELHSDKRWVRCSLGPAFAPRAPPGWHCRRRRRLHRFRFTVPAFWFPRSLPPIVGLSAMAQLCGTALSLPKRCTGAAQAYWPRGALGANHSAIPCPSGAVHSAHNLPRLSGTQHWRVQQQL